MKPNKASQPPNEHDVARKKIIYNAFMVANNISQLQYKHDGSLAMCKQSSIVTTCLTFVRKNFSRWICAMVVFVQPSYAFV
jgi:hypothetical protein